MSPLLLQCNRFLYPPTFIPQWAHHDYEAALVHEGLVVLKFRVHERDPLTGAPTTLSLIRHLSTGDPPPDDTEDDVVTPRCENDDYWGDPLWKLTLGKTLGFPHSPPLEDHPFPVEAVTQTLKAVADIYLRRALTHFEVQVPAATA